MSDETRSAAIQWALATTDTLRAMDAATRLLHIEAILIVYWGAFWSSAGKEHAKGFIEAQLAGMDGPSETWTRTTQ